jgi:hypothetical protein
VRIETAHKILIGSAVVFFAFFAGLEGTRFVRAGETAAGLLAAGGFAAAVIFAIYLRAYVRRLRASGGPGPAAR